MTGFNHGLTGALIAITVKQPALAIPLAFLSHFIQDAIPHWDYGTSRPGGQIMGKRFKTLLLADFLFSLIIMAFLGGAYPEQRWLIWACMIAAAVPDLIWAYYFYYIPKIKKQKIKFNKLARFHKWVEWSETLPGIILETVWFLVIGFIILKLR